MTRDQETLRQAREYNEQATAKEQARNSEARLQATLSIAGISRTEFENKHNEGINQ